MLYLVPINCIYLTELPGNMKGSEAWGAEVSLMENQTLNASNAKGMKMLTLSTVSFPKLNSLTVPWVWVKSTTTELTTIKWDNFRGLRLWKAKQMHFTQEFGCSQFLPVQKWLLPPYKMILLKYIQIVLYTWQPLLKVTSNPYRLYAISIVRVQLLT